MILIVVNVYCMAQRQFLGIKFPFRNDDQENFFIDLNKTDRDDIRSQICHVLFTQKGTRYKRWDFGTDLIKYIFEPSDEESWSSIKNEIKESVSKWVPNCVLNDVRVVEDTSNGSLIHVRVDYSVNKGYITEDDSFIVTL